MGVGLEHNLSAVREVWVTVREQIFTNTAVVRNCGVLCGSFNLLKTKRNLLYIRNQFVPRSKHSITVIKTNQLMMYKAKVAVCSDNRTKHSTQSEGHVEFLNVKPGGT